MIVKSWLFKDSETGQQIYGNGRGKYSVGKTKECQMRADTHAGISGDPERQRLRIEKSLGRAVVAVDGPDTEVFSV